MNHKSVENTNGPQAHLLLQFAESQTSLFRQVDFVKLLDEISWVNMQKPDRLPVNEPLMHFPVQYWPQSWSPDTSMVRKDFSACQLLLVWSWTSLWGCVYVYICAAAFSGSLPYFIRKLGDRKEGYKGRRSDENIRLPQISPSDKAKLFEASYIPSASWITLLHLQTPPKSSLFSRTENLGCEAALMIEIQ